MIKVLSFLSFVLIGIDSRVYIVQQNPSPNFNPTVQNITETRNCTNNQETTTASSFSETVPNSHQSELTSPFTVTSRNTVEPSETVAKDVSTVTATDGGNGSESTVTSSNTFKSSDTATKSISTVSVTDGGHGSDLTSPLTVTSSNIFESSVSATKGASTVTATDGRLSTTPASYVSTTASLTSRTASSTTTYSKDGTTVTTETDTSNTETNTVTTIFDKPLSTEETVSIVLIDGSGSGSGSGSDDDEIEDTPITNKKIIKHNVPVIVTAVDEDESGSGSGNEIGSGNDSETNSDWKNSQTPNKIMINPSDDFTFVDIDDIFNKEAIAVDVPANTDSNNKKRIELEAGVVAATTASGITTTAVLLKKDDDQRTSYLEQIFKIAFGQLQTVTTPRAIETDSASSGDDELSGDDDEFDYYRDNHIIYNVTTSNIPPITKSVIATSTSTSLPSILNTFTTPRTSDFQLSGSGGYRLDHDDGNDTFIMTTSNIPPITTSITATSSPTSFSSTLKTFTTPRTSDFELSGSGGSKLDHDDDDSHDNDDNYFGSDNKINKKPDMKEGNFDVMADKKHIDTGVLNEEIDKNITHDSKILGKTVEGVISPHILKLEPGNIDEDYFLIVDGYDYPSENSPEKNESNTKTVEKSDKNDNAL